MPPIHGHQNPQSAFKEGSQPPKFHSKSPWKNDGWKTSFLYFPNQLFRGELLKFRKNVSLKIKNIPGGDGHPGKGGQLKLEYVEINRKKCSSSQVVEHWWPATCGCSVLANMFCKFRHVVIVVISARFNRLSITKAADATVDAKGLCLLHLPTRRNPWVKRGLFLSYVYIYI